ncbi:MAG: CRISPR-associated endonuclease Cas1 [Parahaliea sp.]
MASTLYLDRRGLSIGLQNKALTLHLDGEFQRSIPLALIGRVVCNSSVSVKTSVLASMAEQGIGVTLFGGRKGRLAAHLGGAGTLDVERRIGQYQCYLDENARIVWAQRLMAHKLLRQQRLLQRALSLRPDQRLPLTRGIKRIAVLYDKLRDEPMDNRDSLRGIEGAAARHYFEAYASILPASLEFKGRNRRPPKDPVNVLLSLGYTLLHGEVMQVLCSVGLDPWLGIYHDPAHGRASLVCDIQELYRHLVDRLVWRLLADRVLREHHFSQEGEACLLSKEGRALFYPQHEHLMQKLRPRLRRILLRLARAWQSGL